MERPVVNLIEGRDPLVGRVVHDRYRVIKRIGKGGMGIVYLAEHVLIGRKVAIKTLSERAFASQEMLDRFQREARAAAAVGDDHVVDVTDMGRLDDGTYYIVMEYLAGIDLSSAVLAEGPFSPARAARVVAQLCDALTAVHGAGIVHRDLKPDNLFLVERSGAEDFVKVLDFGVCKLTDSERVLTGTGVSLGTPHYMAPEQFESSARVDARADLYAVGAILHFLLTSQEPFEAPSLPQLFMRISTLPPPSLRATRPEVSAALEAVVHRALAKRAEDRFQSAAELKAALLSAVEGAELTSGVVALRDASPRAVARRPAVVTEAAASPPSLSSFVPLRRARRRWASAGAFGLVVLVAFFGWRLSAGGVPRHAVGPLPAVEVRGALAAELSASGHSAAAPPASSLVSARPAASLGAAAPAALSAKPAAERSRRKRSAQAAADTTPATGGRLKGGQVGREASPETVTAPPPVATDRAPATSEGRQPGATPAPAPEPSAGRGGDDDPYGLPRGELKDVF